MTESCARTLEFIGVGLAFVKYVIELKRFESVLPEIRCYLTAMVS